MTKLRDEFEKDELIVIALSSETESKVSDYIDNMGLDLRIASGANASSKYGVKGIPAACLIDPEGKVERRLAVALQEIGQRPRTSRRHHVQGAVAEVQPDSPGRRSVRRL